MSVIPVAFAGGTKWRVAACGAERRAPAAEPSQARKVNTRIGGIAMHFKCSRDVLFCSVP